ncbi:MAG: FAD pyrophosphatase (EC [uncultured Aureispira sp.]|uniref:FAD pyrophosphatase (EC) n=1 Tax=uncultured Aureispira sp. TaxID=1331704 RepID=A0A6S6RSD3_9BACT|nr:MAG: FAD pyrophosphatase (EC [uncultured Aureispira sp.]
MNFCSNCGHSPLEERAPAGDNRARIICPNCGIVHYQNPKIVCGCLVIYEGKVLLGKRGIEPRKGKWNVPAGFMENHETVKEGAAREVWEEVRAKVEIQQLHTVYNILHVNQVYCLFLATLTTPVFEAAEETAEVRLFGLDEIPWDDLAFHSNVFSLEKYIENPDFKGVHYGDNRAYMTDSMP